MSIRIFKPKTAGTRNRGVLLFDEITKTKPEKLLTIANHRAKGRNNEGKITIRHRGGGHKRLYRLIDFKRNKYNRIVLYRGNLYHASLDYFGNNYQNGRLFQTFFFNTEY